MTARVRIATRSSAQALAQAGHVADLLRASGCEVELVLIETTGDLRQDVALHAIGGQGVFVKEVQRAVLDGSADLAVHSAKDLPSMPSPGLLLAAVPERRDPHDALVGRALHELAIGATVATGAVRRQAILAARRPDLRFVGLRGNIHTRLSKVPDGGAIVMAVAALQWLGLTDLIAERFTVDDMVPQVGQGALAIECRVDDGATASLLAAIEHRDSRLRVDLERAFLAELGGGCDLPVGAHARLLADGTATLETFMAGDRVGDVHRGSHRGRADDLSWATVAARQARAAVGS